MKQKAFCPSAQRGALRWSVLAASFIFLLRCPSGLPATSFPLSEVASNVVAANEGFWRSCAHPPAGLSSRTLFAYALALCEAKAHPERLDRLFALAAEMQDRNPASRSYGNFHWYRRDTAVLDYNAVDFCMRGGALLWLKHRDFIPPPARDHLRELLELAKTGCLKHKVVESYSNIAIMNAGDLILLGEALGDPAAAAEGYARLNRVFRYTQSAGIHEFDSPTYTGVDLDGLGLIAEFCRQAKGRDQARVLREFLWADIAANWFPPAQRLAGAQSRTYDFLHGLGSLDVQLTLRGWLAGPRPRDIDTIYGAQSDWSPPEKLPALAKEFPRLVRQSWGPEPGQFRTHYLLPDVTLSSSARSYGGRMDMPMTVDFPGERGSVRGYFVADGRDDPFGQKKIPAGPHEKTFHLDPLWFAAQREADALGLVIYRAKDIPTNTVTLQSTFVLPLDAEVIRIGDRTVHFTKLVPGHEIVKPGEVVALRKGTGAVALKIPWAHDLQGAPVGAALIYDGNKSGAICLTVSHGQPAPESFTGPAKAGAAFWLRIGSGLADENKFLAWLKDFASAHAEASGSAEAMKIQVAGITGPVALDVRTTGKPAVTFTPPPPPVVLEVNGVDYGPRILGKL